MCIHATVHMITPMIIGHARSHGFTRHGTSHFCKLLVPSHGTYLTARWTEAHAGMKSLAQDDNAVAAMPPGLAGTWGGA